MGENSKIEWTDATFNPVRGCQRISPGCQFCYAEAMSKRNPAVLGVWGPGGTRVVAAESYWRQPLKWDREAAAAGVTRRVFCASLADVFEAWDGPMVDVKGRPVPADDPYAFVGFRHVERPGGLASMDTVRVRLMHLIRATPNLTWLLLTKRPAIMAEWLGWWCAQTVARLPENLWVGTSVEDQRWADERIPHLLRVPATVRFLSCEPLLGDLDLTSWLSPDRLPRTIREAETWGDGVPVPSGIAWIIVGGESGPGARLMQPDWARSIRDQCRAAGIAYHFKQMTRKGPIPDDLMVREYPATRAV